jgi:hypothetical protein
VLCAAQIVVRDEVTGVTTTLDMHGPDARRIRICAPAPDESMPERMRREVAEDVAKAQKEDSIAAVRRIFDMQQRVRRPALGLSSRCTSCNVAM